MPRLTIQVEYDELPTRTVTLTDWSAICDRLDKGETPSYAMTVKETRAFYVWALKHREYRIVTESVADGIFKLSKGEAA